METPFCEDFLCLWRDFHGFRISSFPAIKESFEGFSIAQMIRRHSGDGCELEVKSLTLVNGKMGEIPRTGSPRPSNDFSLVHFVTGLERKFRPGRGGGVKEMAEWRWELNVAILIWYMAKGCCGWEMKTESVRRSRFEARCRLIICSPGTLFTFHER